MATLENCIIYLIGFPGTGKYTVAKEIAAQENFKLVDSHLINIPIFSLIPTDGKTPLPSRVWQNCKQVWRAVLDTMIHIAPADYNFVLTNKLLENDTEDRAWFKEVETAATTKKAHFVPVRMICSVKEMEKRIVRPERKERLKQTDPLAPARYVQNDEILKIDHPNLLNIDVTNLSASQAAQQILNHARSLQ